MLPRMTSRSKEMTVSPLPRGVELNSLGSSMMMERTLRRRMRVDDDEEVEEGGGESLLLNSDPV